MGSERFSGRQANLQILHLLWVPSIDNRYRFEEMISCLMTEGLFLD